MNRRIRPSRPPSRLAAATIALAIATVGFAILMIRLEVTEEGYRLSALSADLASQQEQNRRLKLEAAQLSSHQRLRSLAVKYGLSAPRRGQVVMLR